MGGYQANRLQQFRLADPRVPLVYGHRDETNGVRIAPRFRKPQLNHPGFSEPVGQPEIHLRPGLCRSSVHRDDLSGVVHSGGRERRSF